MEVYGWEKHHTIAHVAYDEKMTRIFGWSMICCLFSQRVIHHEESIGIVADILGASMLVILSITCLT